MSDKHEITERYRVGPSRIHAQVAELGRRARLRIWCPKGRGGSIPLLGTMVAEIEAVEILVCDTRY